MTHGHVCRENVVNQSVGARVKQSPKIGASPEAGVCAEPRWLQPRGMALLYIVFCNLHIASCNLCKQNPVGADAPTFAPPLPERGGFRKGVSRGAEFGSQLGKQSP